MYLVKIIIFIFVWNSALANEIQIHDKLLKYKISFDENSIQFKDDSVNLSLTKKECIKVTFNQMLNSLRNTLVQRGDEVVKSTFSVTNSGKSVFIAPNSMKAKYYASFYQELQKAKIEEQIGCTK